MSKKTDIITVTRGGSKKAPRKPRRNRTTVFETSVHILKGNIGPGCLSLPWAFTQLGMRWGLIVTVVLFVITTKNAVGLVYIKNVLAPNKPRATYSDVGEWVYQSYALRILITLTVCAQQLGICTVYFAFVADNVVSVFANSIPDTKLAKIITKVLADYGVVVTLLLPCYLALSLIPNLRIMAPVTQLATLLMFVTFGLILAVAGVQLTVLDDDGYLLDGDVADEDDLQWSKIPMAICAILYSYEGINLVLPIESSMVHPSKFPSTFIVSMTIVCLTFTSFAAVCIYTFGDVDDASMTAFLVAHTQVDDNVDDDGAWVSSRLIMVANSLISISVLLTFPLQLFPCFGLVTEIIEEREEKKQSLQQKRTLDGHDYGACRDAQGAAVTENSHPCSHDTEHGMKNEKQPVTKALEDVKKEEMTLLCANDEDDDEESTTFFLFSHFGDNPFDTPAMRSILVVSTYVVALTIPDVDQLISLVGALAGAMNALVLPPLLEWQCGWLQHSGKLQNVREKISLTASSRSIRKEEMVTGKKDCPPPGTGNYYLSYFAIQCYVLVGVGIVGAVVGTVASTADIIYAFQGS